MGFFDSVGDALGGIVGGITGATEAAEATREGSELAAQGQREALEYLKEREAQPQYYREQALGQLGSFYGLPDYQSSQYDDFGRQIADLQSQVAMGRERGYNDDRGYFTNLNREIQDLQRQQSLLPAPALEGEYIPANGQQDFIGDVQSSPFYQSMINQGEQAVGRNMSMTGGLRSGTANEALAQNSQNVLQNLVNQRLQGLQGMANLPSNANAIANATAAPSQTLGLGQSAAAGIMPNMMNQLIGGGLQAYGLSR